MDDPDALSALGPFRPSQRAPEAVCSYGEGEAKSCGLRRGGDGPDPSPEKGRVLVVAVGPQTRAQAGQSAVDLGGSQVGSLVEEHIPVGARLLQVAQAQKGLGERRTGEGGGAAAPGVPVGD